MTPQDNPIQCCHGEIDECSVCDADAAHPFPPFDGEEYWAWRLRAASATQEGQAATETGDDLSPPSRCTQSEAGHTRP